MTNFPSMLYHVTTCGKPFQTGFTTEWFLSSMNSPVVQHDNFPVKPTMTEITFPRHLVSVSFGGPPLRLEELVLHSNNI